VQNTANTFTGNAAIFGKVYFPRLTIPISVVLSNMISFAIRLVVFLVFLGYFLVTGAEIQPNWWFLSLPILIFLMAGIGLGIGIIVSSLTTKYRDLQQLVGFGVQLVMYATPVIYPISSIQSNWKWLLLANPMTPVIELFRYAFLGVSSLDPLYILYTFVFMLIIMLIGVLIFNHVESTFMDTV